MPVPRFIRWACIGNAATLGSPAVKDYQLRLAAPVACGRLVPPPPEAISVT